MRRRGFLGAILATAAAPAIVRAESLMVLPARRPVLVFDPWKVTDHWAVQWCGGHNAPATGDRFTIAGDGRVFVFENYTEAGGARSLDAIVRETLTPRHGEVPAWLARKPR